MRYMGITDLHLGHTSIIEWDQYKKDYEKAILNSLTKDLKEDDILICFGDVAFGNEKFWHELLSSIIPCKKILLQGNHDRNSLTWYQKYWDFVANLIIIKRFGIDVILSHIPVETKKGQLNLHGHFHGFPLKRCFECEPELESIYTQRNIRLQLLPSYGVVGLDKIIKKNLKFAEKE